MVEDTTFQDELEMNVRSAKKVGKQTNDQTKKHWFMPCAGGGWGGRVCVRCRRLLQLACDQVQQAGCVPRQVACRTVSSFESSGPFCISIVSSGCVQWYWVGRVTCAFEKSGSPVTLAVLSRLYNLGRSGCVHLSESHKYVARRAAPGAYRSHTVRARGKQQPETFFRCTPISRQI